MVSPEKVRIRPHIQATGDLEPLQTAGIGFAVPGTLERVQVKRGQQIAEGSVLASLDADSARATLAQAEAAVAAAEAQVRLADDALTRQTSIRKEGGISEAQLFQAQAQHDQAAAQLLGAKAQRDQAQVALRRHTLRAPFPGVVIKVPDGVGFAVGPPAALFTLETTRALTLKTSITQEEAVELTVGEAGQVSVAATGEATPGPEETNPAAEARRARIRLLLPSVDPGTNRVPIEVAVPNSDGRFRPHSFARFDVLGREREAWRVSSATLTQSEGSFAVWVASSDGRAHAVRVRMLGEQEGQPVVSPSGAPWEAGIHLLEAPPTGLAEGTAVAEVVRP
jgi:RND family efflux transporter MFP subunit